MICHNFISEFAAVSSNILICQITKLKTVFNFLFIRNLAGKIPIIVGKVKISIENKLK